MRAYHFINLTHGLADLRQRRLKIACLTELNDPFELFGVNLSNPELRHAFRNMKQELSLTSGLLCFSREWQNPVLWSHYADKHRGICLGFDVSDENLGAVNYAGERITIEAEQLLNPRNLDEETARKLLFTKFSHWAYENEVRAFVRTEDRDPETGLYFADFSENLKLAQVIVGSESGLKRDQLNEALGGLAPRIECFKARLAFQTFQVVRQMDDSLWR